MSGETHAILTMLSIVISLGTIIVGILRGREMIAKSALEAVGSLEGRHVVMAITGDKHTRIEEKLDAIEAKLDLMANSMTGMAVKIAVIENSK